MIVGRVAAMARPIAIIGVLAGPAAWAIWNFTHQPPRLSEYERAFRAYSQQNLDGASRILDTALEAHEGDAKQLYNLRGVVRMRRDDREGALDDWLEAVSLDSEFANAWNNVFVVCDQLAEDRRCDPTDKAKGPEAFALAYKRHVVDHERHNPDFQLNLGKLMQKAARYKEAVDAFGSVLDAQPDEASSYTNLADALHYAGRPNEAAETLRQGYLRIPTKDRARIFQRLSEAAIAGSCQSLKTAVRKMQNDPEQVPSELSQPCR